MTAQAKPQGGGDANTLVNQHNADQTNVHGIPDTGALLDDVAQALADIAQEELDRQAGDAAANAVAAAAQATADAALPKAGGTMTGNIVLAGDGAQALHPASRQWVQAQIAALIDGAPGTRDTLNEIAQALVSDENALTALTGVVAGKLAAANNLSDLQDIAQARTNLMLGTAAVLDVPAAGNAGNGQVVKGNDGRLSDQRVPTDASVGLAKLAAALKPSAGAAAGDEAVRALGTGAGQAMPGTYLDTDVALGGSNAKVPSQAAIKAYVDAAVAAALPQALADAKGDLIVASGADAFTRMPVGNNGQRLVPDSAAPNGLKWEDGGDAWGPEWMPDGSVLLGATSAAAESIPGRVGVASASTGAQNTSGKINLYAMPRPLRAGVTIKTIHILNAAAMGTPTNCWACLVRRSDMKIVATSNDFGAAAWSGNSFRHFQLDSGAPYFGSGFYTPTADEYVYVGLCQAATTVATMRGATMSNAPDIAPFIAVADTGTGRTSPLAVNTVLTAGTTSLVVLPYIVLGK